MKKRKPSPCFDGNGLRLALRPRSLDPIGPFCLEIANRNSRVTKHIRNESYILFHGFSHGTQKIPIAETLEAARLLEAVTLRHLVLRSPLAKRNLLFLSAPNPKKGAASAVVVGFWGGHFPYQRCQEQKSVLLS